MVYEWGTCGYEKAPETLDRNRFGPCTRQQLHEGPCAHHDIPPFRCPSCTCDLDGCDCCKCGGCDQIKPESVCRYLPKARMWVCETCDKGSEIAGFNPDGPLFPALARVDREFERLRRELDATRKGGEAVRQALVDDIEDLADKLARAEHNVAIAATATDLAAAADLENEVRAAQARELSCCELIADALGSDGVGDPSEHDIDAAVEAIVTALHDEERARLASDDRLARQHGQIEFQMLERYKVEDRVKELEHAVEERNAKIDQLEAEMIELERETSAKIAELKGSLRMLGVEP